MKSFFLAVVMTALLAPVTVTAQGVQTGTVRGTVRDQQGLVIVGANVMASSPALQGERKTATASDGTFTLELLPPGDYQLRCDAPNLSPAAYSVAVPLGGVVEQHIVLEVAGLSAAVEVVASEPSPFATTAMGLNVRQLEVERLAVTRDIVGIAKLSPGVSENAPNDGQIIIHGAFAFDNLFMLNGVEVNDNVIGNPQDLYIEDAIQETQTLTSSITAEYGRFSGGVVNAITKSGGNRFSGSLRANLTNPAWTTETPIEQASGLSRPDDLSAAWEGTAGGPVLTDRLWFFAAGRHSNVTLANSLPVTNTPNAERVTNKRGEVKGTGSLAANHTIQIGYLNNDTSRESHPAFDFTADRFSLVSRTEPNWYAFGNYRGVAGTRFLVDAQFSERRLGFQEAGPVSRSLVDSPFLARTSQLQYNAPYSDPSDPEARNNRQVTGSLGSFFEGAGRHQLKVGYEWFRTHDAGGNSPSPNDHFFVADYVTDVEGHPVLDATGHLLPRFMPGEVLLLRSFPERTAALNIDTNSLFLQDHWEITPRFSADLGARFEHVASRAVPADIRGVSSRTIVPRVAGAYDVRGDGRHVVRLAYGWYAGRYIRTQFGTNTSVANPGLTGAVYVGPPGEGRDFAAGFDPSNYLVVFGQFPTSNVIFDPGLRSPTVREFSASYGLSLGRGYVEAAYVGRRTGDLVEDFVETANRATDLSIEGASFTFTNILFKNTDLAERRYDAMVVQGRYRPSANWTISGHYTLQLRNDGNYEGQAPNQPGLLSQIGNYPEAFDAARAYPDGHLQDFQRHRLRLWNIVSFDTGRVGSLSISGLWRLDSGRVYSLASLGQPLSAEQDARLAAYPDRPDSQTIFFDDRGSQFFDGAGLFDTSLNYDLRIFSAVRPFVKLDVFNLFNNQKVIRFNTTIVPDESSPKDSLGLPTGFIRTPRFGQADSPRDFPAPFTGFTGGRSVRLAVGFRF